MCVDVISQDVLNFLSYIDKKDTLNERDTRKLDNYMMFSNLTCVLWRGIRSEGYSSIVDFVQGATMVMIRNLLVSLQKVVFDYIDCLKDELGDFFEAEFNRYQYMSVVKVRDILAGLLVVVK